MKTLILSLFTLLLLLHPTRGVAQKFQVKKGVSLSPRTEIIYFKEKKDFTFYYQNESEDFLEVSADVKFHADKKGKKHILRPPYSGFKIEDKKKLPPLAKIPQVIKLDPDKFEALSAIKLIPKIKKNSRERFPRLAIGGHFIFSNLKKAKDIIGVTHDYKLRNGTTYIYSVVKNEGTGIYYDYTINQFLTDKHGNKIVGRSDDKTFDILAPMGEVKSRVSLGVKIPDGQYNHIVILQNQKSGVTVFDKKAVQVKKGTFVPVKK